MTEDEIKKRNQAAELNFTTTPDQAALAIANSTPFSFSKEEELGNLIKEINNRKFSYDFNADALYQQYKDKTIQQGKMAMADTIGQASAMTGGYGNSYAQSVGQQAYQGQLQNLNDMIPELYDLALSKYELEGNELSKRYGLLMDERDRERGAWEDGQSKLLDTYNLAVDKYNRENTKVKETKTKTPTEDLDYWESAFSDIGYGSESQEEAEALAEKMIATGVDEDVAYTLLSEWETEMENEEKRRAEIAKDFYGPVPLQAEPRDYSEIRSRKK